MVSRKKYGDSCLEIVKEGRKIVKEWREDREERERTREEEGNSADFSLFYKFSTFFMRSISFSLTDCQQDGVTS